MKRDDTNRPDADTLALSALGWALADEWRARRLLDTTGLTPEQLRGGLGDPAMLAAVLRFLESYEPDLIACADAIGAAPADLIAALHSLERQS